MSDAMHPLAAATPLLDPHHPDTEALIAARGWRALRPCDRIGAVYDFVRNEVAFGYSPDAFFARHGSNRSGLKRWLYERVIRHAMNRNVARVRASKW